MIKINNVSYSVGNKSILHTINTTFETGKMHFILGPNGSGKSTLLKIIAGQITANHGHIYIDEKPLENRSLHTLAKNRSFLQQHAYIPFPIAVREVIMMGRYPHFSFQPNKIDEQIVDELITTCQLQLFEKRMYHSLSGGEQQRVQIARVLAQVWQNVDENNNYILLDEPLNNLDIQFQKAILTILQKWISKNRTVILVVHDLNWALQYADHIILMKEGAIAYEGLPNDVLNTVNIDSIYNTSATFWDDGFGNKAISFS